MDNSKKLRRTPNYEVFTQITNSQISKKVNHQTTNSQISSDHQILISHQTETSSVDKRLMGYSSILTVEFVCSSKKSGIKASCDWFLANLDTCRK